MDGASAAVVYEVRDFSDKLVHQGEDRELAQAIYDKYAATDASVRFSRVEFLSHTPAFKAERDAFVRSVPWLQRR